MSAYIKNKKGIAGGPGKWGVCEQDQEDFEQEKLIKEWLEREGATDRFEYKHIGRKGNARNTLIKASVSLDQKISDDDGSRTFADLIAGCDGRDLECGVESIDPREDAQGKISRDLFALGFNKGEMKWVKEILQLSETQSFKRYLKYRRNLAWLRRLKLFEE